MEGDLIDLGPARAAAFDRSGMFAAVAGLSGQLTEGYAAARRSLSTGATGSSGSGTGAQGPDGVALCGMGGSAIGADLVLACLPDLEVPAAVVRGYALPAWVGAETLVVVVSFSGGTEEALACAAQACERGCRTICVTSGGRLAAFAAAEGLATVPVPDDGQPRAAVGWLSMAILATLEAAGLCGAYVAAVAAASAQLDRERAKLVPEAADGDNPAKVLARRLAGRLTLVYGAGPTTPVARRWKGQINENAKAPAFFNELPELDHNELMGWTSLPQASSSATALFIHDGAGDARLVRRAELTAREYRSLGVDAELVTARGESLLARLFSLVQLGDYASCYLALLYGIDPTPVEAIEALKGSLAGDAD